MKLKKKLYSFVFALAIISSGTVFSQLPLALETTLNSITDNYFQGKSTKGLSAVVYSEEYGSYGYFTKGYSHVESGLQVAINSNMKFSLGSNGKLIAAVTILKLQELDSLDLDDEIDLYLPGLSANIDGHITIRQLLNHTSGLADYINTQAIVAMNNDFNQVWTPTEIVQNFVGTPLNTPGNVWHYCNTNYLLAGMIVEAVLGVPYHTAVRDLILTPNNLGDFELMGFEPITGELAHAWDHGTLTYTTGDITNVPFTSPGCFGYAAGGYWGKPKDMVDFYKAIFVDQTILNATSLAELTTTVNTPAPYNTILGNYGLGIFNGTIQGMDVIQHTGSWWELSAVATDRGTNNIAIVSINETEGLSTSVDYQGLAIELLKTMSQFTVGITENEIEDIVIQRSGSVFSFPESMDHFNVYNMMGSLLIEKNNSKEFDLSGFPEGIYLVLTDNQSIKVPYFK